MKHNLKVDWATYKAAKYACENWHYSKCIPVGKLVKVGIWEDSKYIGCVIFSRGASKSLGDKYNLKQSQCVELVRIALTKHKIQVSRVIKLALKFLSRSNSKIKLVISFADPVQGHHGGVYQATNWIYTGKSGETTELFINGRWMHMRNGFHQMTPKTPKRRKEGKHRYLMPLDKEMRKQIVPLSQPYPKRVKQATVNIPIDSGGATPTDTLQENKGA